MHWADETQVEEEEQLLGSTILSIGGLAFLFEDRTTCQVVLDNCDPAGVSLLASRRSRSIRYGLPVPKDFVAGSFLPCLTLARSLLM